MGKGLQVIRLASLLEILKLLYNINTKYTQEMPLKSDKSMYNSILFRSIELLS